MLETKLDVLDGTGIDSRPTLTSVPVCRMAGVPVVLVVTTTTVPGIGYFIDVVG
jgi:hypothetical protein